MKYHHHEVGGPGQCEIEIPLLPLVPGFEAPITAIYSLGNRSAAIRALPTALDEALDALAADHAFLTKDGVFPGDLVS